MPCVILTQFGVQITMAENFGVAGRGKFYEEAGRVKKPGEELAGEPIELIAHHQSPDDMQPYERLLGDAARGDPELFAREDSVEASWRIVDPILDNATPLYEYEPNTWGPTEVNHLVAPKSGWHNPKAKETA